MARRRKEKVFNDRGRKVLRKRIPPVENIFSIACVFLVVLAGLWFATRKDKYDRSERDISPEVLMAQSVEDNLYRTPLKRWADPAQAAVAGAAGPNLGIFSPSILDGGWTAAARLQEFDSSNLYEKINGQEDQYKQFGFQYLHFISIAEPLEDLEINIELYDMGSFSNALGIFAAQRSAESQVDRIRNTFYYATDAGVLGILTKYFFKLTGNQNSQAIRDKALSFVANFAPEAGDSGETPRPLMLLAEGLGAAFQDIEYVLEDVFQYDFAKDFWFGRPDPDSGIRLYLHEAETDAEADELFDNILSEHQDFGYTEAAREGRNVVLQHDFLKNFTTLNQLGAFVYGLEGAPDAETARTALEPLQNLIQQELE